MWDTVDLGMGRVHLSHDMPCVHCGHAAHRYLPCDAECGCTDTAMPGQPDLARAQ